MADVELQAAVATVWASVCPRILNYRTTLPRHQPCLVMVPRPRQADRDERLITACGPTAYTPGSVKRFEYSPFRKRKENATTYEKISAQVNGNHEKFRAAMTVQGTVWIADKGRIFPTLLRSDLLPNQLSFHSSIIALIAFILTLLLSSHLCHRTNERTFGSHILRTLWVKNTTGSIIFALWAVVAHVVEPAGAPHVSMVAQPGAWSDTQWIPHHLTASTGSTFLALACSQAGSWQSHVSLSGCSVKRSEDASILEATVAQIALSASFVVVVLKSNTRMNSKAELRKKCLWSMHHLLANSA